MVVLTSRRFWTAVIAFTVNLITIVIGIYVKDPDYTKLAIAALTGLDTIAAIVVALFTVDDIKGNSARITADKEIQIEAIKAGVHPDFK